MVAPVSAAELTRVTGSREIYVGGKEIAGIYARRYAPGLLARMLRRIETV